MRAEFGVKPGESMSQEDFRKRWNLVIDEFTKRLPDVQVKPGTGEVIFPWKTAVQQFDDDKGTPRLWRIDVELGTVNDEPPTIIYRAKDDPRGWKPEKPPEDGSLIVERSLAEFDRPWLLLAAPDPTAQASLTDKFLKVPDAARPAFFRTEAMWDKLLYQSSVFLSDTVKDLSGINFPISILGRLATQLRLTAGPLPKLAAGSQAGQLELARLFLLRDPDDTDGSGDSIMVQQKAFYCVQAELIEPNPAYLISVEGIIGQISNFDQSLAEFAFWTA